VKEEVFKYRDNLFFNTIISLVRLVFEQVVYPVT